MKNLFAFFAALALTLTTNAAFAHTSPEDVAARCIGSVNQIVDRCQNAAADETAECVMKIRRLLADGQVTEARDVAKECIRSATTRTEKCVDRVNRICNACIEKLLELGAPQLARRVNNACEDAISELRSTLQREKNAIQNALGG